MRAQYDHSAVERKWQQRWEAEEIYRTNLRTAKNPYYALVMFPYPSGDRLHVGHWYNYAPADSYARFQRMQGKDVFSPMGFDAFGLPAENYAIKTGVHPAESTKNNVQTMIAQLKRIGCMYDWEKMVDTTSPCYYRWTQWLFLQMYNHGLAYKKEGNVNFCPSCQTVLANEQAQDGACERCGTEVVQKPLAQWFWKITAYTEQLLSGLETIDWPEKTKLMQRNWIGKKVGIDITYAIEGTRETITCFTTRPDTNFGATFIVLAPEHPFARKVAVGTLVPPVGKGQCVEVATYLKDANKKTELQRQEEGRKKTGVFTGFHAINNLNGVKIPIWVSDFVLGGFGTGAVVGVPGHDLRDFEFAKTFSLPILRVVVGPDGDTSSIERKEQVQEDAGTMINSDFLDGMEIMAAKEAIMEHMVERGWGKRVTTYRLRDWLISRQRYWGAPIPVVYDPEGKPHPIPEEHLPWLLPTDVEFRPTGKSPLTDSKEFIARTEKIFGAGWRPEFDTMDTFVCSSFYYLMYLQAEGVGLKAANGQLPASREQSVNAIVPVDPAIEKTWLPVSLYIGGPEHACMHLIYARFVMMALKDFGFVSHDEPFKKLVHQGLITNRGAKMSKSKGNVVSPDAFIEKHGSDVFRMYLMFMGPFTEGGDWSDTGIKGIDRFVQRVFATLTQKLNKKIIQEEPDVERVLQKAIKAVTEGISHFRFNTAISSLMEFLNVLETKKNIAQATAMQFALLLAPLAPHLSEELWAVLGGEGFIIDQRWPTFDPTLLVSDTVRVVVQVNGKLRGDVEVATGASKEDLLKAAKAHHNVAKFLEGKSIAKEIVVPGKLVSFVVR